jgi:hypothetical protein
MLTGWQGYGGASDALVMGADGDFVSFLAPGTVTQGSATSLAFNSPPPNSEHYMTPNLLTFGGFTFSLVDSAILSQTLATFFGGKDTSLNGAVTLTGTGYVSGNGFLSTLGTWSFQISDSANGHQADFSFSTDGVIPVPEGGASAALLAMGTAGIALLRRRLRAAR